MSCLLTLTIFDLPSHLALNLRLCDYSVSHFSPVLSVTDLVVLHHGQQGRSHSSTVFASKEFINASKNAMPEK
jgi:hypothetical protein